MALSVRLAAAGDAALTRLGRAWLPHDRQLFDMAVASGQERVPAGLFAQYWAEGQAMSADAAIAAIKLWEPPAQPPV
jgi:hypothetical protein